MSQKVNISGLTTEKESKYHNIEHMSVLEIMHGMNTEDRIVPDAIEKAFPQIEVLITETVNVVANGGRIFYIGAGTSGRLGVIDASECPPTFGVPHGTVIGIIAGGDTAIRKSVEGAEDSRTQGFQDLRKHKISIHDIVIGIAASGRTPYVVHALKECQQQGIRTACLVCNLDSEMAQYADYPIEIIVGPEFITGSSRLKAGTAQKLVLNMITTATFAKNGGVIDNKMSRVPASNEKLAERRIQSVMVAQNVSHEEAEQLLQVNLLEELLKKK